MARIAVDKATHAVYQELSERKGQEKKLFSTMKDMFLVCFGLGVQHGVRKPLNSPVDIFQTEVFRQEEWSAIQAVALADSKDIKTLDGNDDDRRSNESVLKTVEEYANAGFEILRQNLTPKNSAISIALSLLQAPEN